MISLTIKEINKSLYKLEDRYKRTYELVLKFMDIQNLPNVGDSIEINEKLLSRNYEGYSTFYTFGNMDNVYGRANLSLDDIDVINLYSNGQSFYLKRLYG